MTMPACSQSNINQSNHAVFRVDASLQIGTGHVMRCLTLAQALKRQGVKVSFISREHIGNLNDFIKNQGFRVYGLPLLASSDDLIADVEQGENLFHSAWLGVSQQEDAQQCQTILQALHVDWLIVDHYALNQQWERMLVDYCQHCMVIDDLGDREHECDMLLDQNYDSTQLKYQNLISDSCRVLLGSQYALLRDEFAHWREASLKRRINVEFKHLLITLGGVDVNNVTGQILTTLKNCNLPKILKITVVMGPMAPHLQSVKALATTMPFVTEVKVNVANMAELMASADCAIGAAGATTWERCCLGLPTIQMVIAENQKQSATALASAGAVKLLNSIEELPGLVETAMDWMQQVSLKASDVCDGLGVERVIASLNTLNFTQAMHNQNLIEIKNYVSLTVDEHHLVLKMRNAPSIKRWMYHTADITEAEHFKFIESLKHNPSKRYFLVKQADIVLGSINLTEINSQNKTAELGIYVNPFLSVKGIGQLLMQQAFCFALNSLYLKTLWLEVFSDNERAINAYLKSGFEVIESKVKANQSIICMQKTLTAQDLI